MQLERALRGVLLAPHRPGHARQRRPDGAVDGQKLAAIALQARIAAKRALLGGKFLEDPAQQLRIDHRLRLRETAQAHPVRADVALHAAQTARLAQSAHRIDHRVQKAKEQQTQIIVLAKASARLGEGAVLLAAGSLQPPLELLDELPAAQLALGEPWLAGSFFGHAATKPVRRGIVQVTILL